MPSEEHAAPPGNPFAPQPAPSIPDHELLRLIGRGAYGEVWLARNAIGTLRAVKIVHRQNFERSEYFEREFKGLLKFEPISRSHGGLVHVLQIGRRDDAGYFFYVMELADAAKPRGEDGGWRMEDSNSNPPLPGHLLSSILDPQNYAPRTLRSELLARTSLPSAECVAIGLKLASALEHLHANGLVHRDIKPSNIIFVNGEPKLADIGLVTAIDDAQSLVGTAGYIPPEGPGTPQADLYSLGKVFYEIAFGKDRQEFPQLPPDLQSHPEYAALLELNEVILKACETDPRLRYLSATALREDLELLQKGKSVLRTRQNERRWRRARHAAAWLAAGVAVLTLVVLASRVRETPMAVHVEKRSTNEVANHAYDLGKVYLDRMRGTNFQVAIDYFKEAIRADPNFGQAYAYLAWTYGWATEDWNPGWKLLPESKAAAIKALKLDNSLAIAHIALGWQKAMGEWSWVEAEKEYKEALRLDPSSSECHQAFGEFLRMNGRTYEALKEIDEARALEPRSVSIQNRYTGFLYDARKFEEVLRQTDQLIAMDPNTATATFKPAALCALGRFSDAIEVERQSRIMAGEPKDNVDRELDELRQAVKSEGPKAYWRRDLANAKKWNDAYGQAQAYAQLGETNNAVTWLAESLKQRDTGLTFQVMNDWRLDPVRTDPRFHAVLKALHFE